MLEVETNHEIILMYYREGLSLRQIAGKLKLKRKIVKARIEQYERFKAVPASDSGASGVLITQYLQTGAAYDSSGRKRRKLTGEILQLIDSCLSENDAKHLDVPFVIFCNLQK